MQHGALTPLGRQLRAVLANLSPSTTTRPRIRSSTNAPSTVIDHGTRNSSHSFIRQSQAAAPVDSLGLETQSSSQTPQDVSQLRTHLWKRPKKRQPANQHLTEALSETGGHAAIIPSSRPNKINLTYVDPKSKHLWRDYNGGRSRLADRPQSEHSRERVLSVQRITSDFVRHRSYSSNDVIYGGQNTFQLTARERHFLREHGYESEDVGVWADIISAHDSLDAANILLDRLQSSGSKAVPIWVLLYTLRRPYISAQALRILIKCASTIFDYRTKDLNDAGKHTPDVFIAVMRLIHHAREVWPPSMTLIVELMLQHLRHRELSGGPFRNIELSNITHLLNKLLQSISISTALRPFKDSLHQEAALLPVLEYMSERSPSLHINRQGYRAVVRIQLPQRKTPEDRRWAELKSLSWPPWKVDRTAMDTLIGPEHGISRAGATLQRMREAGYRPLYWEKLAEVYTGWDIDRTPTIQLRALLNLPGMRFSHRYQGSNDPWSARIQSTRTIQEAWACYLAWEDKQLPPDESVYLSIFTKLYEEEQRRERDAGDAVDESANVGDWPLLAGDSREISPLPHSTHLYTYTRTAPPTVDGFYHMLRERGASLGQECLAFVIRRSKSIEEGMERLRHACTKYPAIESLMSSPPKPGVSEVPRSIFTAAMEMYMRTSGKSLPAVSSDGKESLEVTGTYPELPPGYRINYHNAAAHVVALLLTVPTPDRYMWSLVLQELTQESKFASRCHALEPAASAQHHKSIRLPKELRRSQGALNSFQLVLLVLSRQREQHVDLDIFGFQSFCKSVESAVMVCWNLQQQRSELASSLDSNPAVRKLLQEAERIARESRQHSDLLQREFYTLVRGHERTNMTTDPIHAMRGEWDKGKRAVSQDDSATSDGLPRLLTVPEPAVLHAYIRALGWLADYNGIFATVRWMHMYRQELFERQSRDRGGENKMRRSIVALRVFLERSWIPDATPALDPDDIGQYEGEQGQDETAAMLNRVRSSASPELVEEVRQIVDSFEGWSGWPSDEEVEVYAADHRFGRVMQRREDDVARPETIAPYSPLSG